MKSIFKYIALFLCFGSFAQTLTSPQIGCVSVLPNGNVAITWNIPPDPTSQFASYNVYSSPTINAPSYSLQASIPTYNTNSFTIGINANTNVYYFYIQTVTTTSLTLQAVDTVKTISLTVSGANTGIAHLSWGGLFNPIPAGEASSYTIYKEYPVATGTWSPIATVPFNANGSINYNYSDTITICNDTINYKIELADNSLSCTSVSNIDGRRFKNTNKPSVPRIDSVSVINYQTANPQAVIGISPAYSQDVMCFMIYTYSLSTNELIDSVCNYNQATTYTYTGTLLANGSITLTTRSKDSCGNLSQFPDNAQSTIYTNGWYDPCKKTNVIMWTPYQHMVTGVDHYEVYYSLTGLANSFQHLGDTTATTYYHRGLLPGTNYCYFVRAHSRGKTIAGKDTASSTSNKFCSPTSNPPISQYAYLSNVTVNAQQNITVQWHVDNTVPIAGYNLYRATSKSGAYSLVSFIPTSHQIDNAYTDGGANTNSQEYFYYIQILDTCKNPTIPTQDTSNSIVLTAVPSGNLTATLNWNSYAKYLEGVSGYNVYRSVNGDFVTAATTTSLVTTYVDDLSPFATDEGVFIYYVEAIEGPGNPYSLAEISRSNYDTVYIDANLYIPNAFTPNGHNKVFLPIGAYIDASDYKLSIYNRWGEKIHETTDPNKGWDGGGHEEGVYAYTVQYKTAVGEFRQRNGTVNLIR